jgi:hypothetical protein
MQTIIGLERFLPGKFTPVNQRDCHKCMVMNAAPTVTLNGLSAEGHWQAPQLDHERQTQTV